MSPLLVALSARRVFVIYRASDKVPVDPSTLANSNAQDSATWMLPSIAAAWVAALGAGYGVGIVIHEGSGLFCVDLDGSVAADGTFSPIAATLCTTFAGCYIERSISGRGLHIIGSYRGAPPVHGNKNAAQHLELYTAARYIALTSGTGDVLQDATDKLHSVAWQLFPPPASASSDELTDEARWPVLGVDYVARHKPRFAKLLAGETLIADASSQDLEFVCYALEAHGGNGAATLAYLEASDYEFSEKKAGRMDWYLPRTILRAYDRLAGDPSINVKFGGALPAAATVETPAALPAPPAANATFYVGAGALDTIFAGYTYVNDMNRIVGPDGFIMDTPKFDNNEAFARRTYLMKRDGSAPTHSAWDAFTQSEMYQAARVRGVFFDPREVPGSVHLRDGQPFLNTWRPVDIVATPGDVTPFLTHLQTLFVDWRILLNYCKFMMQRKGVKAMWWPFLQGVPGNGKSFISDTMAYCIGEKFTQRPAASNLDSNFNASLYGCLFLGIDDMKVAEDYGKMWETIKPMVTQTRLEIEAKGVDKVTREVCFNAILNSNHKDGIRKEPDDRRIASFFARQQRLGDLARDGLTPDYFTKLWDWAQGGGWAHVAHYLATDTIDPDFSPTRCPVTSSTAEHIRASRSPAQQEIMAAVDSETIGFKGGWVSLTAVSRLMSMCRYRISPSVRATLVEELGYTSRGRVKLTDGVHELYALPGTTIEYSAANK